MKGVIVTVDTEAHVGNNPVDHLIWGVCDDGERYGISLIMDICDEYNAKALFFVDIAESWDYGYLNIAEVLQNIVNRGHDVGVHLHPDHMLDPKRLFLSEYSYAEQYDMISRCTEYYKEILGVSPKVFRAGKYGANHDTLKILSDLGYDADFSEFLGNKWCGIHPPVTGNKTVRINDGMLEVPTMSYESYIPFLLRRNDKLDLSMPYFEYKYIMKKLNHDIDANPIVFFAHSFSLLKWRRTPNHPHPNHHEIKKFRKMLEFISNHNNMEFIDVNQVLGGQYSSESNLEKRVFSIAVLPAIIFMFPRAKRYIQAKFDLAFCSLR